MITNEVANELAIRYYGEIYSFCCSKLKSIDDASDVTQDVFLLMQENLKKLEPDGIRSWLFSVADKKILEEYREHTVKNRIVTLNDGLSLDSIALCREMDDCRNISDDEINRIKNKILSRLTPGEKELFLKIYDEKMKFNAIAQELKLSEPTVRVRACRLRAKIIEMAEIALLMMLFVFVKIGCG